MLKNRNIKKNEIIMLLGRVTSKLGNIVFDYANSVQLVSMFQKKSIILAIYQSTESIISIIFNLIGGAVADKGSKKRILISTDILGGILCFVVAALSSHKYIAVAMIIANVLLGIITAFNSPTYKSIIKEITINERIQSYNSIQNACGEIIQICGPIVGAFLVGFIGVKGALVFDGITFLLSAIVECFLVIKTQVLTETRKRTGHVIADIIDGFKYLLKEKKILAVISIAAFINFFMSGYNLLIPYTNIMYERVASNFYAKILVAQSLGGVLGSIVNTRIKSNSMRVMSVFLLIMGFVMMVVPLTSRTNVPVIMLVPFFLFAFCVTIYNIRFVTYVHLNSKPEFIGRVFSIISTVSIMFVPIGAFVMSAICTTSQDTSFPVIGIGIALFSGISFFLK
ncbi:MAG: MFS transporter [Prevotella sp.]|nr:MFS transporter [Prevotella sp.]